MNGDEYKLSMRRRGQSPSKNRAVSVPFFFEIASARDDLSLLFFRVMSLKDFRNRAPIWER